MKLCINCAWYGGVALQNGNPVCNEPRNLFVNPVDGFESKVDAYTARMREDCCGREGKWWKEKAK